MCLFSQPFLTQGICIEVTENRKPEILYPNATSTSHSCEIQRYFEASLALMEWLYWEMPGRHPNQCLIYPQLALFNANGQNCFTEPFKHVLTPTFFLIANFSHVFFLDFCLIYFILISF